MPFFLPSMFHQHASLMTQMLLCAALSLFFRAAPPTPAPIVTLPLSAAYDVFFRAASRASCPRRRRHVID